MPCAYASHRPGRKDIKARITWLEERLVDQRLEPGYQQLVWTGRDRRGHSVSTGMYIVLMAIPEFTKSIKLVLPK